MIYILNMKPFQQVFQFFVCFFHVVWDPLFWSCYFIGNKPVILNFMSNIGLNMQAY
jgi:hypothetical protein